MSLPLPLLLLGASLGLIALCGLLTIWAPDWITARFLKLAASAVLVSVYAALWVILARQPQPQPQPCHEPAHLPLVA